MEHKERNLMNRFITVLMSFLIIFSNFGVRVGADATVGVAQAISEDTVSEGEVKAFKLGGIFMVAAGLLMVGAYFPVKEVKCAIDYYGTQKNKRQNFLQSFPDTVNDDKVGDVVKQEGRLWDWAACLAYVIKSRKDTEVKQKDIVKKLFGKCALFEHNRAESLPVNAFYKSGLLESVGKLAEENGMVFVRKLIELGMTPKASKIKNLITKFYETNGKKPFVISDSYFYNGEPNIHFVVISEIRNDIVTVKDPAVGLARKQPLDVFCQGYIYDNGYSKLPSVDMFTFK